MVETQTSAGICAFVSAGVGIAIVDPVTALEYRSTDIVFRRFEPAIGTDFSVLFPSQRPPSLLMKKFVAHVRAFAHAQLPKDACCSMLGSQRIKRRVTQLDVCL